MYTLFFGTNNAAKVNYLKTISKDLPINIIGMNELQNIDHTINESGKEPLENAKIKALYYYEQIKKPVFSIDSGLFFENIEYKDQPGTQVRRVNGKKLTDEEMIEYYSKLAERYGGEITGYYKNAMYIIINENIIIEKDDGKINMEKFILSSKPHEKRVEGWPLDSLSKDIESGKYYYDINKTWNNKGIKKEYGACCKTRLVLHRLLQFFALRAAKLHFLSVAVAKLKFCNSLYEKIFYEIIEKMKNPGYAF